MELSHDPVHEAPLPSASIVLLRDGDCGLEVFLLRRHGSSSAFGGAHVFPGGKVDAADRELDAGRHLDLVASQLPVHLGEPELPLPDAVGLYVAAVRELFEETGVLLAASVTDAQAPCRLSGLLQDGHSFHTALHHLDLRLQTTELAPWSRWITPLIPNFSRRRFDTRFFLAAMPTGQQAAHDNQEAVDSIWLTPRAALQAYWDHQIELAPPQIMGLVQLARLADVDSALRAARALCPPCIEPHGFTDGDGRAVCYPGDPLHPEPDRRMQGPLRLYLRAGRFEPAEGLAGLLP